jgi:hypothetical protein
MIAAPASANDFDLLLRAPDSANALILIDVEQLLMSPLSLREKWKESQVTGQRPAIAFAPDAKGMLLVSKVNWVGQLETVWDTALIEMTHEASIPAIARAEGGYVDKVEGRDTAFSPRDAFMVNVAPRILGVMFPANRQDLARWLKSINERREPQVSPYLREAVARAQGGAPFVMALDLQNLLTLPQVRERLRTMESLRTPNVDREAVAKVLTSLKGVKFSVMVDNYFNGILKIDFAESTEPLRLIAKPLIFEILDRQGLMMDDFKDWRVVIGANSMSLEGRLSVPGMRTIASLIPVPSETLPTSENPAPAQAAQAPSSTSSKADSSRKYFKQITLRLSDLEAKAKDKQNTEKIFRIWADRYADEIDRLPILNVDEELADYGTDVAVTLRSLRNRSYGAGLNAGARQTQLNRGSYYYGGSDLQLGTTLIKRQEKIGLEADRTQVWTDVENKTAEIRKKMTQKYKVEF